MAVQISLSGFHPGPHLAPPVHPYYPPPSVPPAPGPGTHHHQVAPVNSTVKPSVVPVVTSSGGAAGGGSATSQASGQASGSSFDGRRMRSKSAIRRTVDYNCSVANWIQVSRFTWNIWEEHVHFISLIFRQNSTQYYIIIMNHCGLFF